MEGKESKPGLSQQVEPQSNGKQRDRTEKKNPGMACIKPEFIVENHQRQMNEKYLPAATVQEIKKVAEEDTTRRTGQGTDTEVPQKKSKLRGRNKKRPFNKFPQDKEKLCPSVIAARECSYGDGCKFSHDVPGYVRQRRPAHSDRCYLYDTHGKCQYGVSCLCADAHTGENYTQLVNEELWSKSSQQVFTTNKLSFPVMRTLVKRSYNFKPANQVLAAITSKKPVEKQKVERPQHYIDRVTTTQDANNCNAEASDQEMSEKPSEIDPRTGENSAEPAVSTVLCDSVDINQKKKINEPETSVNGALVQNKIETVSSEKSSLQAGVGDSNGVGMAEITSTTNGDLAVSASDQEATEKMETNHDGLGDVITQDNTVISGSQSEDQSVETPRVCDAETEEGVIRLRPQEITQVDFRDKLYLAPLTTVGNLPFRRVCKKLGADITCCEMATATGLLQGHKSEWALLKRHHTEDVFGAQVCGSNVEVMTRCAQVIMENTDVDFIDINCGCPIELFYKKGEGCALMAKTTRLQNVIRGMSAVMDVPLTVKMRTGIYENKSIADRLVPNLRNLGVSMVTLHGRSREQRYTRSADWDYIQKCAEVAQPMPLYGNGDVLSFEEYNLHKQTAGVAGCLIARGALMKPWLFTEIREQRHWDISSGERLDLLRDFCHAGLEHWGSDQKGVQTTRRFLLEWLSFLFRYIPVGLLEQVPQKINQKPPYYVGRNDLETLMASPNCADWIKISEMLLGPVPDDFQFLPKHKANSYQ